MYFFHNLLRCYDYLERIHKKCERFFGTNARALNNQGCVLDSTKSARSLATIAGVKQEQNRRTQRNAAGAPWRRRIAIVVFSLLACGAQASARAKTDIGAALEAASPGDVITIAAGDYGLVRLGGQSFDPPVTLRFNRAAKVKKMRLQNLTGVIFENLHQEAGPSDNPVSENAIFIKGGGNITFRHSSFAWAKDGDPLNDGTLIILDGVNGARIEAGHFSDAREAVVIRSSQNIAIVNSRFTDILEDGMVIAGSHNVLIDGNYCADFHASAAPEAHPDCIQLQTGGRGVANADVVISNNIILQRNGDRAQPIFIASRHPGKQHLRITIENNLSRQATAIGIHVNNTRDLIIRGNQMYPSPQSTEYPRIVVRQSQGDILIENNITSRVRAPQGAVIRNNTPP